MEDGSQPQARGPKTRLSLREGSATPFGGPALVAISTKPIHTHRKLTYISVAERETFCWLSCLKLYQIYHSSQAPNMASQNPPASFGANGAEPPVLPVASSNLSSIFEWAALLPLAIYLASSRLPHQLIGRIALAGFIPIGFFPRLGVLSIIGELLHQGQEYIDRVSSMNDSRRTAWDVTWGSVFPCANGAVSEILSAYLLKDAELNSVGEDTIGEMVSMSQSTPAYDFKNSDTYL